MTELSHIEAIEKEFKQIESSHAWNQVYQKVRSDGSYDFALAEARSAINRPLNRYRDVLPYDHSRIILHHPATNYINASLVKVESIGRQYILTQGPLSSTSQHFWLMVWQQQCKGIIMLNKIMEKNMIKCHQYWPLGSKNGGEDTLKFEGVGLQVDLVTEVKHHHYIYRTLRLTDIKTNSTREVLHFHYTTWPDFGVPQSPEAFNRFLAVVVKSGCLEPNVGPPVIHCSAGIGRSGTFCLVDTLLVMLQRGLCSSNIGLVLEVLLDMRRYRMGLIQTPDQLRFSYQAIVQAAKQRLQRLTEPDEDCNRSCSAGGEDNAAAATNGIFGNGNGRGDDSDSSEGGGDDAPPPPPPPRTDSLTRSAVEAQLRQQLLGESSEEESQGKGEDLVETNNVSHDTLASRSLPAVPPSPTDANPPPPPPRPAPATAPSTTPEQLAATMASEVRRRRQQERNANLLSRVSTIKERQRETDAWQAKKRVSEGAEGDGAGEHPSKRPRL